MTKSERNEEILRLYIEGKKVAYIAAIFNVSDQIVYNVTKSYRNKREERIRRWLNGKHTTTMLRRKFDLTYHQVAYRRKKLAK